VVVEIEAKLAIPNRRTYRALLHVSSLASYALVPAGTERVHDAYFDTSGGGLLAGGFACRLRSTDGSLLLTLKGLGGAEGAVHRRAEHQMQLPAWDPDPAAWPEGPARDVALELAAGAPLEPLVELFQRRVLADVMDGERRVAELSRDAVRTEAGGRPASYYELEAELADTGTEADLEAIVAELMSTWGLTPEPRSKFERALEKRRQRGVASEGLSAAERAALERLSRDTDVLVARRASAILAWDQGLPTREIVALTGMSDGRVRYWVRAFRAQRMAVFPPVETAEPPEKAPVEPTGSTPSAAGRVPQLAEPAAEAAPRSRKRRGLPSVTEFCQERRVDMVHARFVESQAAFLFDGLRPVHRLPKKRRMLLRQSALLNTIGAAQDAERPNRAGRDLILAQPLRSVSTVDRLALACIVAFSQGKVRPEREPTMSALEGKLREQVLPLTAILRVAEALDLSNTQSSAIVALTEIKGERCEAVVEGSQADIDALQATARAELWHRLFGQELVFVPAQLEAASGGEAGEFGLAPAQPEEAALLAVEVPPVLHEDPMPEAGRKVLYLHFTRMLANEAGTRLGEDLEALHDMRVATRRMRAAFDLFEPYYDPKALKPFAKGLRRTGRTLGAVRDLDVLLDKASAYQAALPPESAGALEPLLVHWQTRRDVARRRMLEYLDAPAYRRFTGEFEVFLLSPGAGAVLPPEEEIKPYQVRHLVPRLILSRYEAVRAYEVVMPGAPLPIYHMLRIDCKRLRYAMEFFRDVLGPEAPALIKQVVAMQDLLGELQDAHVAELLLEEFLSGQRRKRKKQEPESRLEGVESYLQAQRAMQQGLLGRFPDPWADLVGFDFRRALGMALAAL
jgi:CHAD domain-containing protein